MLDREALEKAQRKAAMAGVNPATAGNTSAFIRWLIDEYNDGIVITASHDSNRHLFRSIPVQAADMEKFCTESEKAHKKLQKALKEKEKAMQIKK